MTAVAYHQNPALAGRKVRFFRVLKAEWIKLRSLRSTWWVTGVFLLMAIGANLILIFNEAWDSVVGMGNGYATQTFFDLMVVGFAHIAVVMVIMVLAVVGVLALTNEYSSGMIRSTFAAVPRRWPVFATKALLMSLVTVIMVAVTQLVGVLVAILVAASKNASFTMTAHAWKSLLLGAVVSVLLVLMFLGLGALLRSSAAGIAIAYAISMAIPLILLPLLSMVNEVFGKASAYFPVAAANAAIAQGQAVMDVQLSTASALGVVAAWAATTLILGTWRFMRRDA